MRVLLIHNHYQQPGGEDSVFAAEAQLLESYGHEVVRYTVHNDRVQEYTTLGLARATVWNDVSYREVRELCRRTRPAVAHFHNTLPLISPAAYYAVAAEGAAVVQTLHNYRLLCPAAVLYRNGKVCEKCVGTVPLPAIAHGCYRDSRVATGAVAGMVTAHRVMGTWKKAVHRYIALTEFARRKFIQGGLPADIISVKPNFVGSDPGAGSHAGRYALFVGRLSPEKGVRTLLEAWDRIGVEVPLKVVGDGPLRPQLEQPRAGVEWLGGQPREQVNRLMQDAAFLVFPSECYETFGLTIAEAFSTGLPVIGSAQGSAAELVADGVTGLHFRTGDADDLATKVRWAAAHPSEMSRMGDRARDEFLAKYTADRNYEVLLDIYRAAAGLPQGVLAPV